MNARQLKQNYVNFFVDKGHFEIPSASLIPENDSTTLFISAGMHPLVPFLLGQTHPLGTKLVDVQPCVRTGDIDQVGDAYHHTFFEMLGNWSLGDYFKKESISYSFEFLTTVLKINQDHIHVTCFAGDSDAPKDDQSAQVWQGLGISSDRIHFLPKADNWWGPAGATGPCGPDTEIFVDTQPNLPAVDFRQACELGRCVEIWNNVFMQFNKTAQGPFELLKKPNVDTGMGVERTVAVLNGFTDDYLTDIWQPIIKSIETATKTSYQDKQTQIPIRIIADHIRAAVFILAEGVEPSNKEAGYVLRRLIRRAIRQAKLLGASSNICKIVAISVLDNQANYAGNYPQLDKNKKLILDSLDLEEDKFRRTLDKGLRQIGKLINADNLNGITASSIYQSFGFPLEMIQEEAKKANYSLSSDFVKQFNRSMEEHKSLSKTLSAGKFKSGLADNSETITKYHTATHLYHSALRQVLGNHVHQVGSNITADRLRFDFTHPDQLTKDQIVQIEDIVNQYIDKKLAVTRQEMSYKQAIKSGALAFFAGKYPDTVSVYTVGTPDSPISKEVCTGPHVANTSTIGHIDILKQESVGSGKRRLYAKLRN